MLCKKPYKINGINCGCSKCMPCRFNNRRKKTTRLILESKSYEKNCFATLTYADDFIPLTPEGLPTLALRDHQLFLKSLRRRLPPSSLRYYIVGEYGETTQRPHYHAALFGIGPDSQALVQAAWAKGHIHLGHLETESAQYIAGYVTKKMTAKSDPRLNGRYPEYARSSNRGGGMGYKAINDIGLQLSELWGEFGLPEDVPAQMGNLPFDRYTRSKLRKITGLTDGKAPETVLQKLRLKENYEIKIAAHTLGPQEYQSFLKKHIETKQQRVLNFEHKLTLFKKQGTL